MQTTVGELADRKFAQVEDEYGSPDTQPETEADLVEFPAEFDAVLHPTRQLLRQSIVMSEILGPPLALRPPDDRF